MMHFPLRKDRRYDNFGISGWQHAYHRVVLLPSSGNPFTTERLYCLLSVNAEGCAISDALVAVRIIRYYSGQVKKSVDNFIGKYFISSSRLSPAVGGWRQWLVSPLRSLTTSSSPYRQPYGL